MLRERPTAAADCRTTSSDFRNRPDPLPSLSFLENLNIFLQFFNKLINKKKKPSTSRTIWCGNISSGR